MAKGEIQSDCQTRRSIMVNYDIVLFETLPFAASCHPVRIFSRVPNANITLFSSHFTSKKTSLIHSSTSRLGLPENIARDALLLIFCRRYPWWTLPLTPSCSNNCHHDCIYATSSPSAPSPGRGTHHHLQFPGFPDSTQRYPGLQAL